MVTLLHKLKAIALILSISCACTTVSAVDTMTGIFHPDFRTITIDVDNNRLAPPVINLNSSDLLHIGFDRLADERDYLRYSIYHCNFDWTPSSLIDSEVFDGFNYAEIEDYAFSRATSTHYVHYGITLPNEDFSFKISGNYLLKVYHEENPDETLLQVRFMVSEGAIAVGGEATSRTDIDYNEHHQQLNLAIDLNRYSVRDPFNDLKVVVTQNGRVDNPAVISHPSRIIGTRIIYEHQNSLIFQAGNEYRRMETVQMTYPGMGIETIEFNDPYYHHFVTPAVPRYASAYFFDSTQHGRYFVREYNAVEHDIEADYSVVHFTVDMLPIPGREVYIDGDLNYRRFDETARMNYDPENGVYHKAMLLKQGAYNYQFLTLPAKGELPVNAKPQFNNQVICPASTADIEGNFYQTVNEYFTAVYYRAPGERYDRLLGYTLIFSGK